MKISDKITAIREAKGLNKKEFAAEIHVSPGYVSDIEKGNKEPSDSLLDLIMEKWDVSEEWWETEDGPMFKEKEPDLRLVDKELIRFFQSLPPERQKEKYKELQAEFNALLWKEKP
jgi:transcriptional regulator with XRE-family HTH domain